MIDKKRGMPALSNAAKAARAAYVREWRRKNPDRANEYTRKYWERKAEKALAMKEGGENV